MALRTVDLFGTRAAKAYAKNIEEKAPVFVVRGPYRWVRHPWYLGVLMLFWACTDFTADRLLFNVLWTGWVCIGTVLEERDLVHEFGEAYRKFQPEDMRPSVSAEGRKVAFLSNRTGNLDVWLRDEITGKETEALGMRPRRC